VTSVATMVPLGSVVQVPVNESELVPIVMVVFLIVPSEPRVTESAAPVKAAAKRRKQDGGKDPVAKIVAKADRKPSGLDLAAKVLADAGEPLKAKQIAERAIAAGWKTNGKTPEATLYAAMTREIAKKGDAARFRKADRGLFEAGPKTKKGA